jgi:nucleotide-binding universal stress UspA family protein
MNWLPRNRVVVPVDFSDESLAAVDTALAFVDDPQQVHVIHVLPELEPTEPGVIWNTIDDASRKKNVEEALRERLADERFQGLHFVVTIGDPGHEIADLAADQQADLIVMPSHGRRGLRRVLLGSVAERVLRLAHCPVLVLRK